MSARPRVLLASRNPGKVRELARLLDGVAEVVGLDVAGITGEAPETGATFAANARQKALHYGRDWPNLVLADDSGLEVDALDGAPGVRSARFGGPDLDPAARNAFLLDRLAGVPSERRTARFVCVLALARDGELLHTFTGRCAGRILEAPAGTRGFGYDPVFYYPPAGRSFAELTPDEKAAVSHRGRALRELRSWLEARERQGG